MNVCAHVCLDSSLKDCLCRLLCVFEIRVVIIILTFRIQNNHEHAYIALQFTKHYIHSLLLDLCSKPVRYYLHCDPG